MEQKIYEYVFSAQDYNNLQKSLFTKDILGSSWNGDERIVLYKDRIEAYQGATQTALYHLEQFESFYAGPLAKRSIVLIKKYAYLSPSEKYFVPVLFADNNLTTIGRDLYLRIRNQGVELTFRTDQAKELFSEQLAIILPRKDSTIDAQSYSTKNYMMRFLLALSFLVVVGIFIILSHLSN